MPPSACWWWQRPRTLASARPPRSCTPRWVLARSGLCWQTGLRCACQACPKAAGNAACPAAAAAAARARLQVPVPRGAWDDSAGFVALTKYATAEARAALEAGMLQSMASGYLAYAAAGALLRWVLRIGGGGACRLLPAALCPLPATFYPHPATLHCTPSGLLLLCPRYLEVDSGLVLAAGSLAVRHLGSDTHMHIDAATAAALELIHPIRVGSSAKRSGMGLFRCGGGAPAVVVPRQSCLLF